MHIIYRFVTEDSQLSDAAKDLVDSGVEVIVALGQARVEAAKKAATGIPIVMASVVDPVEAGLITNLARPEGNLTGVSTLSGELAANRLAILKEAVPGITRVAVLSPPGWSLSGSPLGLQWVGAQAAAEELGISLELKEIPAGPPPVVVASIEASVAAAAEEGHQAIFPLAHAAFTIRRDEVARFAARRHLASIYSRTEFAESGGLLAYGPSTRDEFRVVARTVDKLLRGSSPKDVPIQQPDTFELTVNLATAREIGVEISARVLRLATTIIE